MNTQALGLAANALKKTRPALLGHQLRVIPVGDSITQGSSAFTSGMWQYGPNYCETSLYLAGSRFRLISNAGIGGQTTSQILARMQTDVWALNPDVVLLGGGTNDLQSGSADSAFTTCFNNLEDMAIGCLQRGILPVIVAAPPKAAATLETRRAQIFYRMLANSYGLPLIDLYSPVVDPTAGTYLSGLTSDGTHPTASGVAAMAAVVGPALANLGTMYPGPYLAKYSEATTGNVGNLIRNGNFARAASSPTPDGWTVNATGATQTIPTASAPYNGNTFTYVKTATSGVYALFGGGITTGFAAGDTLVFSGRIKSSGRTGTPTGFNVELTMAPSSTNFRPLTSWTQDGDFVFSSEVVVPAGTTSIAPHVFVNDIGTIEVNNLTLWNRTAALAVWSPRYL